MAELLKHASTLSSNYLASDETPEEAEERKNKEAIVQGFLGNRVVWVDSFCRDLWLYMKQKHVGLGILLAHSLHPYSRCERLFVFLSLEASRFGFSLLLLDQNDKSAMIKTAALGTSIALALMNTVALKAVTCACVQEGSCLHKCFGESAKAYAEKMGFRVAVGVGVIAALIVVAGLKDGAKRDTPMMLAFQTFVVSQLLSIVISFVSDFVGFVYAYWGCVFCCRSCFPGQAGAEGSKPSSAYPHGPEYPTDLEMFWNGDHCTCGSMGFHMASRDAGGARDASVEANPEAE